MKKRILMLTLVLMIVLSSFSFIQAADASKVIYKSFDDISITSYARNLIDEAINDFNSRGLKVIVIQNATFCTVLGYNINRIVVIQDYQDSVLLKIAGQSWTTHDGFTHIDFDKTSGTYTAYFSEQNSNNHVGRSGSAILYSQLPIYNNYVDSNNSGTTIYDPDRYNVIVSIKPSQRILFNYAAADKDKFLKSLSCTPKKSITVHQAYYSGGQVTDMVIKKDTTDLLIGGSPLTLSSFPSHRTLNTNEYLGYSQANGGNWVWTDFIPGSNGGPVGTDSNSLVTFTIDTRYCSYRVVSANTGLEITSGGIADVPQVPDDGIYNNNQNPWGPGDITDDYLLDRADYEDGIIGDIQYGFDTLFKFLKMPFELLYKFIMTLGEIIQYALGTVSGFTTALQGIYAILPGPIWFLVIMAISINVFKLIFGR